MNNLDKFKTKILNKLQYDKELKELQIKEIDELMNEYKRPIFDKDNITLIKNNYKIKYLELKNKFNNDMIDKLKIQIDLFN
mgnify:FL=1